MATLKQIADEGIRNADRLEDLAEFCRDWGRETGDARYLFVGELFRQINDWWGEQGIGQPLLNSVNEEIRSLLPAVLAAADPADGSRLADVLSERVQPYLVPTDVWARENRKSD